MAKLKPFKSQEVEVLPPEPRPKKDKNVAVISETPTPQKESLTMLNHLEKAGYGALALKIRDLQGTEGLEALDPLFKRLSKIEKQIDDMLALQDNLEPEDLRKILKLITDLYHMRAKALLLPYGTISPRTAITKGSIAGQVNIAVGIGNGLTPRPK